MSNWVRVATVSECTPGSSTELVAGDRMIALFNVDGEFFALDGVCPHQGGPLGQGDRVAESVPCDTDAYGNDE